MAKINGGGITTGRIECLDIHAGRSRTAIVIDDKDPPIAIDTLTFGNPQPVLALALGAFMLEIGRIDPRDEIIDYRIAVF